MDTMKITPSVVNVAKLCFQVRQFNINSDNENSAVVIHSGSENLASNVSNSSSCIRNILIQFVPHRKHIMPALQVSTA
jgi:hypothetical protein